MSAAAAVTRIRDEHLALASVLYALRAAVRRLADGDGAPDHALLRALLDYVVEFPERLHHPKEDRYLFAALAARAPAARTLIDELAAEHAEGAVLIERLSRALARYRADGAPALPPFADAALAYCDFHWKHMRKEEEMLLPLAQAALTAADWEGIAAAFRANDDPLHGLKPGERERELYRRIVDRVPATGGSLR